MTLSACQTDPGGSGETEATGSSSGTSTTSGPATTLTTEVDTTRGESSSGDSSSGGAASTTSADSDTTATGCVPGEEEGCACDEAGQCGLALECRNDICVAAACGNGMVDAPEECDDMNLVQSDGCDNDCTISSGGAAVIAGDEHVCVIFHTGEIKCWGNHENGRLGYPGLGEDLGNDEVPGDFGFVDVGGEVEQLALGSNFTCARLAGDDVVCWGRGQHGRLGQGDTNDLGLAAAPSTIDPISLGGTPIHIAAGAEHACAAFADGTARCWGRNDHGQLGVPGVAMIGDNELPSDLPPIDVGANVLLVAAGTDHTCAVLGGGDVRCWGANDLGQLGVPGAGDVGDDEDPATSPIVTLDGEVVNISARFDHTCVSYVSGDVQCWGAGGSGRLGLGTTDDVGDDEEVDTFLPFDLGFNATHLATGQAHTCVRLVSTGIFCWGEGDNGRLGLGNTVDVLAPLPGQVDVSKAQGPGDVTVGAAFSCTRTQGSEVKCWGRNNRGQLGQGLVFPTDIGDNEALSSVGPIVLE